MKKIFLSFLTCMIIVVCELRAQDAVGINNDSPHASAILDVSSTSQGVLVPRMTDAQRLNISSPAQGLLIYNTTTNTFWYRNNSSWVEIASSTSTDEITDADEDTKIQVEESSDEDIIRFDLGGTEYFRMDNGRLEVVNTGNSVFLGQNAGRNDDLTDNRNVFVGSNSGASSTSGEDNVAVGYRSLNGNTSGSNNIAIGRDALRNNETGVSNVAIGSNTLDAITTADSNLAIGFNALTNLSSGTNNVAIGQLAMRDRTSGDNNLAIGNAALQSNLTGSNNVAVGRQAGLNATGSGNVFLGYQAGRSETGDDKLYIENSSSTTPLIWGDFNLDSLVINGDQHVTGDITYVGTLSSVSDRRLKEDFDTLQKVMHFIDQLQAYSYHMKLGDSDKREYGLIAQEVEKVFPEMVKVIDKEKGYKGVNYLQMVAILVQGLKEQQELIELYERDLKYSQYHMESLKAEVEEIKTIIYSK